MNRLIKFSLGLIMLCLVAGCAAGVGPNGGGVVVGYSDQASVHQLG